MKKLALWIALLCIPAVAQILSPIFFQTFPGISYCTVPGYPAAPKATPDLWFSADCITFASSVCGTPSNGSNVTTWADRSGNGNDGQSGTGTFSTNQINGKPAVTITSHTYTFKNALPSNNEHTLFQMIDRGDTASGWVVGGGFGSFFYLINGGAPKVQEIDAQGSSVIGKATAVFSPNTFYNTMGQESGTTSGPGFIVLFHLNEAVDTLASSNSALSNITEPTSFGFGSGVTNARQAELIYYTHVLSAADIVYNECYLYGKYGR